MTKFYNDGNVWILGDMTVPAGTMMKRMCDDGIIEILRYYEYANGGFQVIAKGGYSDFSDINGAPYASMATFKAATDDFFVKALSGDGAKISTGNTELKTVKDIADSYGITILNQNTIPKSGYYLNTGDGAMVQYQGGYYSDFYPITDLVDYYYTGSTRYRASAWVFYNSDKTVLSTFPTSNQSNTLSIADQKIIIPANAAYIRFGSLYSEFSVSIFNIKSHIKQKTHNKLYGKKIAFIGDSVTEGQGGVVGFGGWCKIIGESNNMNWHNYGVSGSKIAIQSGKTNSIQERLENYSSDFDYVLLQGGLNDIVGIELGSITTGWDDVFNRNTFCGGVEYLFKLALTKYNNKKVGFLITYLIGSYSEWNTRADLIEQICKKWGMPYLDLRKYAGFNLVNSELRAIYGVSTSSYPVYSETSGYLLDNIVKYNGSTYKANQAIQSPAGAFNSALWTQVSSGDYDYWHCNVKAYQLLAPRIEAFLQSL